MSREHKIYVRYRKPFSKDLKNALVGLFSRYSHAELYVAFNTYTSTMRNGVVKIPEYRTDAKYVEHVFKVTEYEKDIILNRFKEIEGKKYDWRAVLLYPYFRFLLQNKDRYYCSEVVSYMLQDLFVVPLQVTPSELHHYINMYLSLPMHDWRLLHE